MKIKNLILGTLCALLASCTEPNPPAPEDMMTPWDGNTEGCMLGQFRCGSGCVDVQTSIDNCGRCDNKCGDRQQCVGGACKDQVGDCRKDGGCSKGYYCDLNSGACKQGCGANPDCGMNEACDISTHKCTCDSNSHDCAGKCVRSDDVKTCGTRCDACPTDPNGMALCYLGMCDVQCKSGFRECSGVPGCSECCRDYDCPFGSGKICASNKCVVATRCTKTSECGIDEACTTGICTSTAPGGTCTTTADCPNGQMCQSNKCAVVSCPAESHGFANSACPVGAGCRKARCVNLIDASCSTWSDCGNDYTCDGATGTCKLITGSRDCTTNYNCTGYGYGYACVNGHCQNVGASSYCQADVECGFGAYCGRINKTGRTNYCTGMCSGTGYPSCTTGYSNTCSTVRCKAYGSSAKGCCSRIHNTCTYDSDCNGYKCVSGRCASSASCTSTASCQFAEKCESNVCKFPPSRTCTADNDCGNGQVCMSGKCGPEFEASGWN